MDFSLMARLEWKISNGETSSISLRGEVFF